MTKGQEQTPVVILGGGATGAMVAYHLLRLRPDLGPGSIVIIEPRATLGTGLAYSTTDPAHRINVPAARMSIDTAHPDDFRNWLDLDALEATDPEAILPSGDLYPSRYQFGLYLADRLAPALSSGRLRHIRARASSIHYRDGTWQVQTDHKGAIRATCLVLALTHPAPRLPAPLQKLANDPRVVTDPWSSDILDGLAPRMRLAIIGTGLTMADCVASATARGHTGPIFAFSRRGLRSRSHATVTTALSELIAVTPQPSARLLLREVRARLADHDDLSWHDILDAVRRQGALLWKALPVLERKRLIRHLRPFWDVHRFRIAPQVNTLLNARIASGSLLIAAARLDAAKAQATGIRLSLTDRRGRASQIEVDRVINTTGPDHTRILATTPCLATLVGQGILEPDPSGLGLHTDANHRAVGKTVHCNTLFIAGPLSRGQFGELMGLPEVTANAQAVARALDHALTPILAGPVPSRETAEIRS